MRSALSAAVLSMALSATTALAAVHESPNFRVIAPSEELARLVADLAEQQRLAIARRWFGRELPDWPTRCTIVFSETEAQHGLTRYEFFRGEVRTLEISLHGDAERAVGVFLPHEVVHAVVVSGLGRRPPRWADEGIAMTAEPPTVRDRQCRIAAEMAGGAGGAGLRIRELLEAREYPASRSELPAFYARSHALVSFLVARGDCRSFLDFVERGTAANWDEAVRSYYGYDDVESLEAACTAWLQRPGQDRQPALLAAE